MAYERALQNLSSLLRSLVNRSTLSQAKQSHLQIIVYNNLSNVTLQTDLLFAYIKCGSLVYGRKVFDRMSERNMHSWNILIYSYVKQSQYSTAISLFYEFLKTGFRPDHYTLPPLFKASGGVGDVSLGLTLHGRVIRLGFDVCVVVGSSVLEFYVKGGNLVDGWKVFNGMLWKDCGVWNLMISGFARAGFCLEALSLFRKVVLEGRKMDALIIPSVLNGCGGQGDLMKGKEIHGQVVKNVVFDGDVVIGNSLIDMYAKCGSLHDSQKVFNNMRNLNVVTWTAMISCYGVHGKGEEALAIFKRMNNCGFKPNAVTLTAVLSSCSHAGLLDQGRSIFNSISTNYGLEPAIEHCACMVDLLARFGQLEEALGLVQNMKLEATASIWGALLAGCVVHKNVEVGEIAAQQLFILEPRNSSNYVALICIYESHGFWDGISMIKVKMRELGLLKTPGCSWITIMGNLHRFYQGDTFHLPTKMTNDVLHQILKGTITIGDCELE